ncbi:MAG: hypothetical protein ABI782_07115 [Anaerolineaceae bacterium]
MTAAICGPARRPEHLTLAREGLAIELDEQARFDLGTMFGPHL